MNTKPLILAVAAATMIASGLSHADQSGFTITPSVGFIDYEKDRALDPKIGGEVEDDIIGSLGLGYRFDNPWAIELSYKLGETEILSGTPAADVDFEVLHLDALYHFDSDASLQPYAAFGVGHLIGESDQTQKTKHENNLNAGGGFKYAFNDLLAARSDIRIFRSLDDAHIDLIISLGLQLSFGAFGSGSDTSSTETSADTMVAETSQVVDTDGDGVTDADDSCPITPVGIEVDANGCALDDDGDQVPNHRDNCPASEAGSLVDADGCYVVLEIDKDIELEVNFANNSDVVTPEYYAEIQRVADFMKKYPDSKVVIEGHTDSGGTASYNQQLSERRAKAVARTLVDRFNVDSIRVASVGHGEAKPIANNSTAVGRATNRRVVAKVSATVEKRAEVK